MNISRVGPNLRSGSCVRESGGTCLSKARMGQVGQREKERSPTAEEDVPGRDKMLLEKQREGP